MKIKRLISSIAVFVAVTVAFTCTYAAGQSTRRKNLRAHHETAQKHTSTNDVDTITDVDSIAAIAKLYSFQKTVASRVESIMISNLSDSDTIIAVEVDLNYRNTAGEQLNRRTATFTAEVPPGETRHATVPSWDRQQLFYFVETPPARPTQRTAPFTVTMSPKRLLIKGK